MNLGSIMDMIQKDPSIPKDIDAFLKKVNEPSIAEQNGGVCTQEEVLAAIDALAKQPLLDEANIKHQEILDDIKSGVITTVSEVTAKYGS